MKLFSPAKLNLFFRVLGRRHDGYHDIASIMQTLDFGDEIRIERADSDALFCSHPEVPLNATNLILKAAEVFRAKTGKQIFAHFHLKKKVPLQAGLGGGSSNAATALWGLNALCGYPASTQELAKWASEFSSDAPFFFSQGTAYCTGRGEIFRPLAPLQNQSLWIAKPEEGLSTPLVYAHCIPSTLAKRDPLKILESFLQGDPHYFNDLEQPAFKLLPSLSTLKNQLLQLGFSTALMTGSGTAFFCFGEVESPFLEGIRFYRGEFLNRTDDSWYELPHFCYYRPQ